jgi:twinkle protein
MKPFGKETALFQPYDHTEESESVLIGKGPCADCGSSDACCSYSDGHTHCFSCGIHHKGSGGEAPQSRPKAASGLLQGNYAALTKRKLTEETAKRYQYKIGTFNGNLCQIATYHDESGAPVAQKLRFADKKEGMPWLGDKKAATLFGAHLYGKGKRIVITEGEIDAMSVAQAFGNKWPAVSLRNGADGARKDIAAALEYLANFEEIVLMFDMDEPGRAAVEAAAEVLTGQKVFVASLPLKDANECLVNGRVDAIMQGVYNAKPYAPASVLFGQAIVDRLKARPQITSYPYPSWMPEFNRKVLGFRLGELDVWTSGSGMGKTTLIKQLQLHIFRTTPFNQAIIHLEEPLEDTAESLVGVMIEKRLNLPEVRDQLPEEAIHRAAESLFMSQDDQGNHRIYLHDAFGSMGSDENLMNRIRYYAHAHDCKVVWIDHLSILVSGMGEEGDERRRIDALMHNLKELTVELGIYIGLISHLKKAAGTTSFEEGAVPTLDDLRGSGGIKQLSNSVYAISRNQQAETEIERNTAQLHVLKSRYTGDTGPGDFVFFNKLTGTFEPGTDPELASKFGPIPDDEFASEAKVQEF